MEEYNNNGVDAVNEYFKTVGEFVKAIDRGEEAALWKRAKKGDAAARARLLQMHLRLVIPTAKRFRRLGADFMDLVEEGNLGLLRAIDGFEPSKGYRFSTYAIHWIEQFIRRAAEEQSSTIRIPSHAWENMRAWSKTWDAMREKLGREPTLTEMAARMDLSARQVRSILDTLSAAYGVDSLSSAVNEEDDITLGDTLTDAGKGNPDDLLTDKSSGRELLKILEQLPPRDREVLLMRYGVKTEEIMTLAEVSRRLGVSRERVRQIEERAVRNVQKRAGELGLIERSGKNYAAQKNRGGKPAKQKTDILGNAAGGRAARKFPKSGRKNTNKKQVKRK
ncbi:MAG: RNA polymerase sigma factor RpoD/SigA [Elusimicrobiota bacterium]|nr:RNA polymerase sigma factor RpoD/SigA [Elusimicrobiota bacterium]